MQSPRFQFSLKTMVVLSSFACLASWATHILLTNRELNSIAVAVLVLFGALAGSFYGMSLGRSRDVTILGALAGAGSVWITICVAAPQLYAGLPWPKYLAMAFLGFLGLALLSLPAVAIGAFCWRVFYGRKEDVGQH